MSSDQLADVLCCYAAFRFVRPKWIECLTEFLRPAEMVQVTHVRLLAALGTLQRLHDKTNTPKKSLFAMDYLPSFVRVQHHPLFRNQVDVVRETLKKLETCYTELDGRDVSTVVYAVSRLAPREPSSARFAVRLTQSLMAKASHPDFMLEMIPASILLYGLCRLDVWDASIIRFLLSQLLADARAWNGFPLERISMILYSMARIGFHDRDIIMRLLEEAQHAGRLGRFSAWDLSSLFYSLSRLHFKEIGDAVSRLGHEIARSRRLSSFSEQGVTLVLYALGQMQFKEVSIIQVVLDEVLKPSRTEELTYRGLCMMVHGLSKLSHAQLLTIHDQHHDLLQLLADSVKVRMETTRELPPAEIVSLLFGCALCQSHLSDAELQGVMRPLLKMSDHFGSRFLRQLSPKELLILIKSLTRIGFSDEDPWMSILSHVEREQDENNLDAGTMSAIAYCCGAHCMSNIPKAAGCMNNLLVRLVDGSSLKELSETELVCLFQSAFLVTRESREKAMPLLVSEIYRPARLSRFAQNQLVTLISLILQRSREHETKELSWVSLLKHLRLAQLDDAGLVSLLYSLSKHRPKDVHVAQLLDEFSDRSGIYSGLKGDHLSMVTESIANAKISDKSMVMPVIQELTFPGRIVSLSDKALVLLLHSLTKLKIRNLRLNALIIRELRQRVSVATLSMDLLSMLLHTLGKSSQYDRVLFEQAIHRLESSDFHGMEALGIVNILDAISRTDVSQHDVATRLACAVCAKKRDLSIVELHVFLHAVGRLKLKDSTVKEYLKRLILSERIDDLDAAAMSGLVLAASETGVTDPASSQRILSRVLDPSMLDDYNDAQLRNVTYRLHGFNSSNDAEPHVLGFAKRIEEMIRSDEISVLVLGVFVIGFGKLAEKYPEQPALRNVLLLMTEDRILDQMSTGDLFGHIVAASSCPNTTLELARRTADYILKHGHLHSCSKPESMALAAALLKFHSHLQQLPPSLALVSFILDTTHPSGNTRRTQT